MYINNINILKIDLNFYRGFISPQQHCATILPAPCADIIYQVQLLYCVVLMPNLPARQSILDIVISSHFSNFASSLVF